jgi:hypothetical protein
MGQPGQLDPIVDAVPDDPNRTKLIAQHGNALALFRIDLGVSQKIRKLLRSRRAEGAESLARPSPTNHQRGPDRFPIYVLLQSVPFTPKPGDILG